MCIRDSPYSNGVMMGFHQNPDGCLTFGFGQRYAKYDLMGRKIWNRRIRIRTYGGVEGRHGK